MGLAGAVEEQVVGANDDVVDDAAGSDDGDEPGDCCQNCFGPFFLRLGIRTYQPRTVLDALDSWRRDSRGNTMVMARQTIGTPFLVQYFRIAGAWPS